MNSHDRLPLSQTTRPLSSHSSSLGHTYLLRVLCKRHPLLSADCAPLFVVLNVDSQAVDMNVGLVQDVFAREHNAIADMIAAKHPDWGDQKVYEVARLVTVAVVAKIHTVDWTCELLKTPTMWAAMNINWGGIAGLGKCAAMHLNWDTQVYA